MRSRSRTFNRQARRTALAALALAVLPWASARADRIDGEWCDGARSFKIDGARIVTPGGNAISGDYGRHDFVYVIPTGEPGAGEKVDMRLMDEEHVHVSYAREPPKVWRRCKVTS
jgi:hypothetical protein